MKDTIISFKTAQLAKEVGFNWYDDNTIWISDGNNKSKIATTPAPSQSLLSKWLREVHNIDVWAVPFKNLDDYKAYDWLSDDNIFSDSENGYNTYEEAFEEGLYQALKLIEKHKT